MEQKAFSGGKGMWDEIVNTVSHDKDFIQQVVDDSTADTIRKMPEHPVFHKKKSLV